MTTTTTVPGKPPAAESSDASAVTAPTQFIQTRLIARAWAELMDRLGYTRYEQIKLIGPLTDPVAHGGKAEDAFDVVIPSMPGYGFSGKPTGTGWGPQHMARAWASSSRRHSSKWTTHG